MAEMSVPAKLLKPASRTRVYRDLLVLWMDATEVLTVWCPAAPALLGKKLGPNYTLIDDDFNRIAAMEALGASADDIRAALMDIVVRMGYVPET